MKRLIFSVLVLGAVGCTHVAAPRYYTLDMTPSGTAASKYNLEIDRLRPNEALARADILIQTSAVEVEYYALERWAAGLHELVPEKLEAEFGPRKNGAEALVVSGSILGFEQVDLENGAEARIKLDLEFRRPGQDRYEPPALQKIYEIRLPSASEPAAIVESLSRGLEKIAAQIVADVDAL